MIVVKTGYNNTAIPATSANLAALATLVEALAKGTEVEPEWRYGYVESKPRMRGTPLEAVVIAGSFMSRAKFEIAEAERADKEEAEKAANAEEKAEE